VTGAEQSAALSAIARAIAGSLELSQVFARVADACRVAVPFERMWVARLERPDALRVFAVTGLPGPLAEQSLGHEVPRAHYSPRVWPAPGAPPIRVGDAARELDPAYPIDAAVIEGGMSSLLIASLDGGSGPLGLLWLEAQARHAFAESHAEAIRPVSDLVALALAHDRLWHEEQERRRRQDALQALLPALAEALDIRAIFKELSRITQDVIPHDYVSLGLFTEDRKAVRIHATSEEMGKLPEFRFPDPAQAASFEWDFLIVRDLEIVPPDSLRLQVWTPDPTRSEMALKPGATWVDVYRKTGVHAQLRVPVRLHGRAVGALTFHSRTPDVYSRKDVELAVRVADHVALALAHQELAAQARRAADATSRADALEQRVQVLAEELDARSPHRALGGSRKWRDVLVQATKVAPTDTTVLVMGESGTGKEVVARFIYRASPRKDGPFVALNCAALPEQLLESELFGHEKGAFTGALTARPGRLEQAARGVLFLDEVGEMSLAVQAKFLRVLQEREYQRLGGTRTLKADARVLAATNRNLKSAVSQGTFREDLYYRLAVFDIALPPLRERPDDIMVLAEAFLEEIGRSVGRPAGGLSEEVREKLVAYSWPGNVRELRNALERAVILCEGGLVTSEHLPMGIVSARAVETRPGEARPAAVPVGATPVPATLDAAERELIAQALSRAGNNKSKAARQLGLTRAQLRTRIEKYGLSFES
jgi:transcriptional regulator with GAF, ATPase, and Fis domain